MDKEILLNAFPRALENDVLAVMQILPFGIRNLGNGVMEVLPPGLHDFNMSGSLSIRLNDDVLVIPGRVYFDEPDERQVGKLTDIQRTILHCIYLRHRNGFVRQRNLETLGERNEYWITPYTLQLLGEYVYEIIEVLDKLITDRNIDNFSRLAKENPKFWQQTEGRVASYWDAYHRWTKFPKLKDYPGRQIADRIRRFKS